MARPRGIPSYRKHSQSGLGVVTLTDGLGGRRDVTLGEYGTAASRAAYLRVVGEWQAAGRQFATSAADVTDLTVNELLSRFLRFATGHYRHASGEQTSELAGIKLAASPLVRIYGFARVSDFGPLALKAVRESLIKSGICRNECNKRTRKIVRIFRWAVENELVSATQLAALRAVKGLARGRSEARESEPVRAVASAHVDAVLPYLNPTVRAMVELARLTGARPSEIFVLRACDIDMSVSGSGVWLYRPQRHKNSWRDRERIICIGPKGQGIIRPLLKLDLQAYIFDPRDALAEHLRMRREHRQTKLYPSHVANQQRKRRRKPKRRPTDTYDVASFNKAIFRACDRAFPPPECLAKRDDETNAAWRARLTPAQRAELAAWRREHRFSGNRLRHLFATEARKHFNAESAQTALGHASLSTTEIYAEKNLSLAVNVAAQIG